MHIHLICIGQRMPTWVNVGYQEYAKRLTHDYSLHLTEIPLRKRSKSSNLERLQRQETEDMLAAIPPQSHIIALDEKGQQWTTSQLSQHLFRHSQLALLVGGPEGLSPPCLQKAHQHWSLSSLTFPHSLVRIIVAEQIYRAWTLLTHHPYHRA